MKAFRWDKEKNLQLQNERRVSFEQVITAMEQGSLLDVVGHPNREKYSSQRLFIVKLRGYAYIVPFVETEKEIFLKTIIPNRKATQKYLSGE